MKIKTKAFEYIKDIEGTYKKIFEWCKAEGIYHIIGIDTMMINKHPHLMLVYIKNKKGSTMCDTIESIDDRLVSG